MEAAGVRGELEPGEARERREGRGRGRGGGGGGERSPPLPSPSSFSAAAAAGETVRRLSLGPLAFFCCAAALTGLSMAQDRGLTIREPAREKTLVSQRVALVIGNSAYDSTPLRNPANDARTMAAALRDLGFDVVEKENLNQKDMKREAQAFGGKLQKGGIGLFYFAGHGMQVIGCNYCIPVGARTRT